MLGFGVGFNVSKEGSWRQHWRVGWYLRTRSNLYNLSIVTLHVFSCIFCVWIELMLARNIVFLKKAGPKGNCCSNVSHDANALWYFISHLYFDLLQVRTLQSLLQCCCTFLLKLKSKSSLLMVWSSTYSCHECLWSISC